MPTPTNQSRTELIYRLMLVWAQYSDNEADSEELIIDLLTDLHFYCDEYAMQLAELMKIAERHYAHERYAD
jgi:hypothetical protein